MSVFRQHRTKNGNNHAILDDLRVPLSDWQVNDVQQIHELGMIFIVFSSEKIKYTIWQHTKFLCLKVWPLWHFFDICSFYIQTFHQTFYLTFVLTYSNKSGILPSLLRHLHIRPQLSIAHCSNPMQVPKKKMCGKSFRAKSCEMANQNQYSDLFSAWIRILPVGSWNIRQDRSGINQQSSCEEHWNIRWI